VFAVLGPLTRTTKETLNITNPNSHDIAFKVKTTAPKLYCVRPNAGVVPAGQSLEVQGKQKRRRTIPFVLDVLCNLLFVC
jgi:hypothetical protein